MGIIIRCADRPPDAPQPWPIAVDLICDEPSKLLCAGEQTFTHPDGFIAIHAAAMKAGWLERYVDRGRLWLCPVLGEEVMIRDLEAELERAWMIGSAGAVISACCAGYLLQWWFA